MRAHVNATLFFYFCQSLMFRELHGQQWQLPSLERGRSSADPRVWRTQAPP